MANLKLSPVHIIQNSKYPKKDDWQLDDISLCPSGNIAVSGHRRYQTYVCIYGSTVDNSDSGDKPTLLYHRQFKHKNKLRLRYISFKKPSPTEIVTCWSNRIQVIDYKRNVYLRSRLVNGTTTCLCVSESQIFIGLRRSGVVNIYDNELNRIKSIRLKELRDDWPRDIAAADSFCVCTSHKDCRAIVYSQDRGSIVTEYTSERDNSYAHSIAVNIQYQSVTVLWNEEQVTFYSLNNNKCKVLFDVEPGVSRIRISDQGRIVTGYRATGELKIFDLAQLFTYDNCKLTLTTILSESDLKELVKHFNISGDILKDDSDGKRSGKKKAARLFRALEKKGLLQDKTFHHLKRAFSHLGSCNTSMFMSYIDFYQKHSGKSCITEISVSVPSRPSDHIEESLLRSSVQRKSNSAGAKIVVKQINQLQSNRGQPPLQEQVPALQPPPTTKSLACSTGKRGHTDGVHSAGDNGLHGKRAKVPDDSQATCVSTHAGNNSPVTQPSMVQSSFPRDLQSMLSHYSDISCLKLLSSAQPIGSEEIQQTGSLTELQSPNRDEQNGQLQVGQQEMHPGAPSRAQQVVAVSIAQTPHTREHVRHMYAFEGLPKSRNPMPLDNQLVSTERHSQKEQLLQTAGQSTRLQMAVMVTQHEDSDCQQTENSVNFHTLSLGKQGSIVAQSVGQQIRQAQRHHMEQNFQQSENAIELQHVEQGTNNVGQVPLRRGQVNKTRGRGRTEHELHMVSGSEPNTQQTVKRTVQLGFPSDILQHDLSDEELQTGLEVTKCEPIPASSHVVCEQMLATAESPFQKCQANVLRDIHEKIGYLVSSSKSRHLQETPGTSFPSRCKHNVSEYVAEHKQGAIVYLESLHEDDKNLFLSFKDMSDDREELVRRLVEKVFSGEERKNGNTSGSGNFQKLDEDRLQKIRSVVFYLCPITTKRQFSDKLQDKEWKRLCEVIDAANRHYRQELKRQTKRKERLPKK